MREGWESRRNRMVERCISSPQEIAERYKKVGVVIFLVNSEGKILLVQEHSENPNTGKESGTLGVICETSREGERWEETVVRGLSEELGIDPGVEKEVFMIDPEGCFLGETLFIEGVLARVIVIHWRGDDRELFSAKGDGEISIVGWERPAFLISSPLKIRRGVEKVIQECLAGGLLEGLTFNRGILKPLSVTNLEEITESF